MKYILLIFTVLMLYSCGTTTTVRYIDTEPYYYNGLGSYYTPYHYNYYPYSRIYRPYRPNYHPPKYVKPIPKTYTKRNTYNTRPTSTRTRTATPTRSNTRSSSGGGHNRTSTSSPRRTNSNRR